MATKKQGTPNPPAEKTKPAPQNPLSTELIWSYWMEQSMLVQVTDAIARHFQNTKASGKDDPLAQLDTAPLRPLNNLLWSYIQDEQHRLTVRRRAYEYDHHYGITLKGEAAKKKPSGFQRAFHTLLQHSTVFFKNEDDAGKSGAKKLWNSIRDVKRVLAGKSAGSDQKVIRKIRNEMRVRQNLLARPEMQAFLGIEPPAGSYQKRWMSIVDTVKTLQGWDPIGSIHYHNLAVAGEKILLSIRHGHWDDPDSASKWATAAKNNIKKYIKAYRIVSGVNLSVN